VKLLTIRFATAIVLFLLASPFGTAAAQSGEAIPSSRSLADGRRGQSAFRRIRARPERPRMGRDARYPVLGTHKLGRLATRATVTTIRTVPVFFP